MADNTQTLADAQGEYHDWIEIHNGWSVNIKLGGWYLTDDPTQLTKWQFPDVTLGGNRSLVVYASGEGASGENAVIAGQYHTNFKLDADGEYLALVNPGGGIHQEFAPTYPQQYEDISYGLTESGPRYFAAPTPGSDNGLGLENPNNLVVASHPGGTFVESLSLEFYTSHPEAVIHYTLDGSRPTVSSPVFDAPVVLTRTTFVQASAVLPGEEPGPVLAHTYVALDSSLESFSSNLPLAVVDTFGTTLNDDVYSLAASAFIDTPAGGRTTLIDSVDFAGPSGIKIRGSSSQNFPKKQFAFETWDTDHEDSAVSLFGLPEEADWVLNGPYSDKTFMRNYLAYKWSNDIGWYAPRTVFFELYLNTDGDGVVDADDYHGIYVLIEKIKRDSERVDVEKMTRYDNTEPEVTGGYILKHDRLDPGDTGFNTAIENHQLLYVEPKEDEITAAQAQWLSGHLNEFETALHGADFADPETGYAAYIDVMSFIDQHILNEWMKNIDGFKLSQFFYLDRGGKLTAGPMWDMNLSLGNANYRGGALTYGWYYETLLTSDVPQGAPVAGAYKWYPRLFEDPNFQQLYIDRWAELRETVFSLDNMTADIDEAVDYLAEARARDFARWPRLGEYIWPNPYVWDTYEEEIQYMKDWITERVAWIDEQYLPVPTFSDEGGFVEPDFALSMEAGRDGSSYAVYYTLDGSDPRQNIEIQTETAVAAGSVWSFLDDGSNQGTAWIEPDFDDSAWDSGPAKLGYGNGNEATVVDYGGDSSDKHITTYFRREFEVTEPESVTQLVIDLLHDDGAAVYLNGHEIVRANLPEEGFDYLTFADLRPTAEEDYFVRFETTGAHLVDGTNVLAVEIHQHSPSSSDLGFDMELEIVRAEDPDGSILFDGTPISFSQNTLVTARAFDGLNWSGPETALYLIETSSPVRITEVMYNPRGGQTPAEQLFDDQEFEFIEITNTSVETVFLAGLRLSEGIEFDFANGRLSTLAPGESAVVVENEEAFRTRYGEDILVAGQYSGKLSNGGERIVLSYGPDVVIHDFTYDDSSPWPSEADGDGYFPRRGQRRRRLLYRRQLDCLRDPGRLSRNCFLRKSGAGGPQSRRHGQQWRLGSRAPELGTSG